MSESLAVFTDGVDIVIASDPVDATKVWESITFKDHRYRGDDTQWRIIPGNETITVWLDPECTSLAIPPQAERHYDEDGVFVTAEARKWVKLNHKGLLRGLY